MSDIQTVCVFCSASDKVDDKYKFLARDVGALCAERGWNVVYGGSHSGLMGVVADTALAGGVQVTGVMPAHLRDREVAHKGLTALHITETMHERQMKMADLSDAFIVLPGGIGTMAEFCEVLVWKQMGLHQKPIVLLNLEGYWEPLIAMLDQTLEQGFLHSNYKGSLQVIDSIEDLFAAL